MVNQNEQVVTKVPSVFSIIGRELKKDKWALASTIILTSIILFIFIFNIYIRMTDLYASYHQVDILNRFLLPGEDGFLLGTDSGGHSVFGWLMMGAANSLLIALGVTTITIVVGTIIGLVLAYYGGLVDDLAMRVIDFLSIIPYLMIIIVFVSLVKNYDVFTFILILSSFAWIATTRLVRSKALSEARRDYVLASKTMGTSDWEIMLKGILPNIGSIVIVEATLTLAFNMGVEVSLSYLGFGLPSGTPSLGTLLAYARDADLMVNKMYIWFPAALLVLIMTLCINYIGQAMRRALDAKQRL